MIFYQAACSLRLDSSLGPATSNGSGEIQQLEQAACSEFGFSDLDGNGLSLRRSQKADRLPWLEGYGGSAVAIATKYYLLHSSFSSFTLS